jgi:glycosyltransferase involved in cell wall biosynthesis
MLIVPERFGELRSLMLEAMAVGLPVVASADPYLDMLAADENAVLIEEPEPEAWARGLRRVVSEPDFARALGGAGRRSIADGFSTSAQMSRLVEALARIAAGGNYAFLDSDKAGR